MSNLCLLVVEFNHAQMEDFESTIARKSITVLYNLFYEYLLSEKHFSWSGRSEAQAWKY
jgi:hypothetical protein